MTPTSPAPPPPGPDPVTPEVLARVMRRVSRWGGHLRLQAADRDDAQEQAVLAVLRALRQSAAASGPPASLDAFVELVVFRSLWSYLRAARRLARHYEPYADVSRLLEGEAASGGVRPLVSTADGPAEAAERHEAEARLAAALGGLTPPERQLYELWASGESLRGMAKRLGVSVKVVRGRLPKLLAKLSAAVGQPRAAAIRRQPPH